MKQYTKPEIIQWHMELVPLMEGTVNNPKPTDPTIEDSGQILAPRNPNIWNED